MSVTRVTSLIAKASLIAELLQLRFMRDRRELRMQYWGCRGWEVNESLQPNLGNLNGNLNALDKLPQ
jgi:hypothetical protein